MKCTNVIVIDSSFFKTNLGMTSLISDVFKQEVADDFQSITITGRNFDNTSKSALVKNKAAVAMIDQERKIHLSPSF